MEYFNKLMKSVEIIGLAHGALLGFQYFPIGDLEEEEDWNEFNIYLLIICIRLKW